MINDKITKILALIPARSGSESIPHKNIHVIAGKPLLAHSIDHALASKLISRTVVSTDSVAYEEIARQYGAEIPFLRPPEISNNNASSESALMHTLDQLKITERYEPDIVVFLQCTSPVRRPDDIDNAILRMIDSDADSLLSVTRSHRFIWRQENDALKPLNYDYRNRPRRQELTSEYAENGSIYIFKPWVLRQFNNRLGGKIALYEMDYWSSFEIDTADDLALCEWILQNKFRQEAYYKLPEDILLIVFDFDGVLTDNRVVVFQDGKEGVLCHRGDGLGLERLRQSGIPLLVLSREANPVVQARCNKLHIECRQHASDKKSVLIGILKENKIDPSQVIFVGNDINDLECMKLVGCSVAPSDAYPEVLANADIVLGRPGGYGAVRELCDLILNRKKESINT